MRTLLTVFCALLLVSATVEARKKPASQNNPAAKQAQARSKAFAKAHKAPKTKKHKQTVN